MSRIPGQVSQPRWSHSGATGGRAPRRHSHRQSRAEQSSGRCAVPAPGGAEPTRQCGGAARRGPSCPEEPARSSCLQPQAGHRPAPPSRTRARVDSPQTGGGGDEPGRGFPLRELLPARPGPGERGDSAVRALPPGRATCLEPARSRRRWR